MDAGNIIKLRLTAEQAAAMAPVLAGQKDRRKGAILGVVDVLFDAAAGGAAVTLTAAWLPWRAAAKIGRKITREAADGAATAEK